MPPGSLDHCPMNVDVQHVAAAAFVMDALHGRENTVYNINPTALKCKCCQVSGRRFGRWSACRSLYPPSYSWTNISCHR